MFSPSVGELIERLAKSLIETMILQTLFSEHDLNNIVSIRKILQKSGIIP